MGISVTGETPAPSNEISTDSVIEQSRVIKKRGRRQELRHFGGVIMRVVETTAQATGAVILAGPTIIHEAGADVSIPRTATGIVLAGLSVVSARKMLSQIDHTGEAIQASWEEASVLLQDKRELIEAQLETLDTPEKL